MSRSATKSGYHVAVVGAGLIGCSWTVQFLSRGYSVVATDADPAAEERLARFVERAWPTRSALGLAPEADPGRWTFVRAPEDIPPDVPFVQESVRDTLEAKRAVFARLDALLPEAAVIGSPSSALLMTPIQEGLRFPGRCLMGHPMNPPHLIPLVEVSGGEPTEPAALDRAMAFYRAAGMSRCVWSARRWGTSSTAWAPPSTGKRST